MRFQNIMNRRTALTTTAAGLAGLAAGAGPAVAAGAEHPDAELLDLERQFEALIPELARAGAEHSAAQAHCDAMMPAYPPEAAEVRRGDSWLGLGMPSSHDHYWVRDMERCLARSSRGPRHEAAMGGPLRPKVKARIEEILAAYKEGDRLWRENAAASGWDAAGAEDERLWETAGGICARVRGMEPQTLEGWAIKAGSLRFRRGARCTASPKRTWIGSPRCCAISFPK